LKFKNFTGVIKGRQYSDSTHNITTNTIKGLLFPPPGGMFEVRYPEFDISGAGV